MHRHQSGKRKLIMLEGPDGSGKSSLAALLKDVEEQDGRSAKIIHAGPPDKYSETPVFDMFYPALFALHRKEADTIIMDRTPVSELVYGPILRDRILGSDEEWVQWNTMERGIVGIETVKYILDAPYQVLEKSAYQDRGEDFVPPKHFRAIVDAYRDLNLPLNGWNKVFRE